MPSALTALLATGLAFAAHGGRGWLAAIVLLLQCALVFGWFATVRLPGGIGGFVVALAASVAADGLLLFSADSTSARPLTGLLGLVVVAAMLAQLARRDGRPSMTASTATAVAASAVAVAAATYLSGRGGRVGVDVVVVGAAAVGVSGLAFVLPTVLWLRAMVGVALGTGVGWSLGQGALGARDALIIAVVAAVVAAAVRWGTARVAGERAAGEPVEDDSAGDGSAGADSAGDRSVDSATGDSAAGDDAGERARQADRWSGRAIPALMIGTLPLALAAVPVFVLGRLLAG